MYTQRHPGGFVDLPSQTTPIDSLFLNRVEASLLRLDSLDPTADGQVLQWIASATRYGPALLLNKNIDPAANIDWSKLNTAGKIFDADVAGAAGIARSKLNFGAGLVNTDLAANAGIASSKLADFPWTTVYRKTAQKDIATLGEQDLLNSEITIPANALGPNGFMLLIAGGDWLNNTTVNRPLQLRWKLGATTLWDNGTVFQTASNANRRSWTLYSMLANTGATNSQFMLGHISMGAPAAAPPAGWGVMDATAPYSGGFGGTAAEDTTTVKALALTITHPVTLATLSMRLNKAFVAVWKGA